MRFPALLFATSLLAQTPAVYDVVITSGRIVDGTGNAWFRGDVGVRGDRIAKIASPGQLALAVTKQRLDARGMVVAPGFIDIQGQSRGALLVGDGRLISKVTQGITTEIMGEGRDQRARERQDARRRARRSFTENQRPVRRPARISRLAGGDAAAWRIAELRILRWRHHAADVWQRAWRRASPRRRNSTTCAAR